jgi:tRNA threonylcarbamoyladenosine biosynthesis protein TsaB
VNILGIDTATRNCSVGLVQGDRILATQSKVEKFIHATALMGMIQSILSASVNIHDLDAIAVSIGPGSYTGLRIGLSTAKGLALPRALPVLPVPTLAVLRTVANKEWSGEKIIFIRSHRDFVYYQYCTTPRVDLRRAQPDGFVSYGDLCNQYAQVGLFVGDAELPAEAGKTVQVRFPDGITVARLAWENYACLKSLSRVDLEPEYYSDFEAVKWKQSGG